MTDEGGFLKAILANPADDLPRLVYADWLDEQQTEEASRKAEFLRLMTSITGETRVDVRANTEERLTLLARHLPTNWLPIVSRLEIENCPAAGNAVEYPPPVAQVFDYVCPKDWGLLTAKEEVEDRFCERCQQTVHYCDTITSARRHAADGHCIAIDLGVIRRDNDLRPRRMFRGKPSVMVLQQEAELAKPDEVSAEREARRQSQPQDDE